MAFVFWLGLICGVFVASSPVVNPPPSLALLTSNQTSYLRPNPPFLNLGVSRPAVTSNSSGLGDDAYRCSSQTYGRPLAEGCQEAYEAISDSSELLLFRDRTAAQVLGIALPLRTISSDGKSVVELSLKEGAVFDRVSGEDLRKIASSLVQLCVVASHEGGAAFKIGELGHLTLSVQEYTPNVECSEPETEAADIESCQDVLDEMSAKQLPISFGHRGNPAVNVGLPLAFQIGEIPYACLGLSCLIRRARLMRRQAGRACVIELKITGEVLIASWYKMWAAAVAAVGMCVRRNQDGVATVEGSISSITLSVSRPTGEGPSGVINTA